MIVILVYYNVGFPHLSRSMLIWYLVSLIRPIVGQRWVCVCVCVCARAKSLQLCQTLYNPMDCSPPRSSLSMEIFQTRILECVAMASSRRSSQPRDWTHVSYVSCTGRKVLYLYPLFKIVVSIGQSWEAGLPLCNSITLGISWIAL